MTVTMFEPADGVRSRRERCVELILSRDPREDITYDEVMDLLDCDRRAAQQAMDAARRTVEADGRLSIVTRPNFGYVRCDGSDMLELTRMRARRSMAAARRRVRTAAATVANRHLLDPIQRSLADHEHAHAVALHGLQSRRVPISLTEIERRATEN